ncbi:MAG: hypothetical protein HYW49_00405 [Deltaproteobacteria bacterium]|nr:hypothetical protein [Deltaproteobacteria bacterium]
MKNVLIFLSASLMTVFSCLAMANNKDVPPLADYAGRTLYLQALDQIVVGYKMGCRQGKSGFRPFGRYREAYNCRKLVPAAPHDMRRQESETPPVLKLQAVVRGGKKNPRLSALRLVALSGEAFDSREKITGERVLDRVIATIEERMNLTCTQKSNSIGLCTGDPTIPYCNYKLRFDCKNDEGMTAVKVAAWVNDSGTALPRIFRIGFRGI